MVDCMLWRRMTQTVNVLRTGLRRIGVLVNWSRSRSSMCCSRRHQNNFSIGVEILIDIRRNECEVESIYIGNFKLVHGFFDLLKNCNPCLMLHIL